MMGTLQAFLKRFDSGAGRRWCLATDLLFTYTKTIVTSEKAYISKLIIFLFLILFT